jgi:hypothetical protein
MCNEMLDRSIWYEFGFGPQICLGNKRACDEEWGTWRSSLKIHRRDFEPPPVAGDKYHVIWMTKTGAQATLSISSSSPHIALHFSSIFHQPPGIFAFTIPDL